MFKKVLFLLVISCCWCLLWCKPTRDFDDREKYDVITDERQTGVGSPQANFHLKFDGLLVAVPGPNEQLLSGVGSHLYSDVLEGVFSQFFKPPLPPSVTEGYPKLPPANVATESSPTNIDNITTTDISIDTTTIILNEDASTGVRASVNLEAVSNADKEEPLKFESLLPAVPRQSTEDIDKASLLSRMHRPDEDVPPPVVNKEYLETVITANKGQATEGEKNSETTTDTDVGTSPTVANKNSLAPSSADIVTS